MNQVAVGKYPARTSGGMSGSSGGDVDDIFKRLGTVEATVSDMKAQLSGILAVIPHLATKADLGVVEGKMSAMETRLIKWMIATLLTCTGLAFTIAKFVH